MFLYADDTVIIADNAESFQKCLNDFNNYCDTWKLNINLSKTKVVIFGSRSNGKYNFRIGPNTIDIINEYKYLGVYFNRSGSFFKST